MDKYNRVIIDKSFIKESLFKKEELGLSLSRFIDNSIQARQERNIREDPCKVKIDLFENLIVVSDNSGGIKQELTDGELFKIGNSKKDSQDGVGMKKSLCRLGNKIEIISNREDYSKKFSMDLNQQGKELISMEERIDYNPNIEDGTTIYITDLEKSTIEEIKSIGYEKRIIEYLGRRYSKFIDKGEVIIEINRYRIKSVNIQAEYIDSCVILGKYNIYLYKGYNQHSGIDIFLNDYMIYNRVKNKEVLWNYLNEAKHTYSDCIVEVNCSEDKEVFEDDKEELFKQIIDFIKSNRIHFKSKTIIIQYEMPIEKVEELKDYYEENTAKGVGIKAFNKLYENYIWNTSK